MYKPICEGLRTQFDTIMPRERRPFNRSVTATDKTFIDKTQTAVNFLMTIYGDSNVIVASIATAQTEGNKEVLIGYLGEVRDFCDSLIKEITEI